MTFTTEFYIVGHADGLLKLSQICDSHMKKLKMDHKGLGYGNMY